MPLNRIIAIGASSGGIDALCSLVKALPADLPAAVLIVQHIGRRSVLASVLQYCGPHSTIAVPEDGGRLEPGRIYVAIPDYHLTVADGRIRLVKGPRENLHRPSIDVLFRSVARAYGPKAVGVVLTGALDDGASGIFAIKIRGGVAVVQDPKDALVPDMPRSALRAAAIDHCVPLAQIAPLLIEVARTPPATGAVKAVKEEERRGEAHPDFVCPECDGPLTEYREGDLLGFRCKTGHRFSLDGLSDAHAETLERGVWIAIRILEDRAAIQRLRARKFEAEGRADHAASLIEIADQAKRDAQLLREIAARPWGTEPDDRGRSQTRSPELSDQNLRASALRAAK